MECLFFFPPQNLKRHELYVRGRKHGSCLQRVYIKEAAKEETK